MWFQDVVAALIVTNSSLFMDYHSLTSPYSVNGSMSLEERISKSTATAEYAASTLKNSHGRILRPDEVQSENLPKLATSATPSIPRRPLVRHAHPAEGQMHTDASHDPSASSVQGTVICTLDVGVNTDCDELSRLEHRVQELEKEVSELKAGP